VGAQCIPSGPQFPQWWILEAQAVLPVPQEALADLTLQLQLVRREKRGLELRDVALRAQGPAHVLLLEQLRWERAQLTATRATNSSGGGSSEGRSSDDEEEWPQVSCPAPTQLGFHCCPKKQVEPGAVG
jgi:hypothetical protein